MIEENSRERGYILFKDDPLSDLSLRSAASLHLTEKRTSSLDGESTRRVVVSRVAEQLASSTFHQSVACGDRLDGLMPNRGCWMVELGDDDFVPFSTHNPLCLFLCESELPTSLHRVEHASIRPDVADAVEDLHCPFKRSHGLLGFAGKEPLTEGFLFGHFKPPGAQPPNQTQYR